MDLILQVFYSVFSGLLLSLAIPNELYLLGFPLFTLIALIPLYIAYSSATDYRQGFLIFFIQTITTHLFSSFWLSYFKDFAYFTLGASAVGTAFIGGFMGLIMYLPYSTSANQNPLKKYAASQLIYEEPVFRVIYFASIYALYEWVKSSGFLGYPWGTVSSAIFKWPVLMQLASITGTYGITFLISLFNGLMAEFLIYIFDSQKDEKNRSQLILIAKLFSALIIPVLLFGLYQYNKKRIPQKILTAIMVQQNSDPWKQASDSDTIILSEELTQTQYDKLQEQNRNPDLIIWSEGCLKNAFPMSENYYNMFPEDHALMPFVRNHKTPLLAGAPWVINWEKRILLNTAILFDKQGETRGYYGKNHLVPFAETIPFREFPAINHFITKVVGISAGWTPGDQYTFFDIPCSWYGERILPANNYIDISKSYKEQMLDESRQPVVRISTPICFDDAFTDIMRPLFLGGTELFVNLTDDSWSLTKSSEYQHFAIASYRAIEYRTTLVRSTNAGYSAVITPQGKIIADMPLFEAASIACDIPVYEREMTVYARFGNWFPYTLAVLVLIYCFFMYKSFSPDDYIPSERKKRKKKSKTSKNSKNKK